MNSSETKRFVNPGAEELMGVTVPVLDKGYIKLVEYSGTDTTVVAAARHSYDQGVDQDDTAGNERLINFLMRERHTSPFEQPMMVWEVKAPILVFRQWQRHRTPKLNEMSGRYVELPDEFYVPELQRMQRQSSTNRQGSGERLDAHDQVLYRRHLGSCSTEAFRSYHLLLDAGLAKELARVILPVNTYSKMIWQCDLHNLLHFLKLRMAPGAQWEIRQYANEIAKQVESAFPQVWEAFEEHVLYAKTLSRSEIRALLGWLEDRGPEFPEGSPMDKLWKKLDA